MTRLSARAQNTLLAVVAIASVLLVGAILYRHLNPPSADQQALEALDGPFVREWAVYWLAQKDADAPAWREALSRCADTHRYRPNCTHIRIAQFLDAAPAIPAPAAARDLLEQLDRLAPLINPIPPPARKAP